MSGPSSGAGPDASTQPGGGERQATYAAWADRMRSHKQEKLAGIESDATSGADASTLGAYWDSHTLFEESRRLEESRDPTVMGERELLAEFGLSERSTIPTAGSTPTSRFASSTRSGCSRSRPCTRRCALAGTESNRLRCPCRDAG
jgi:hypothetical protein